MGGGLKSWMFSDSHIPDTDASFLTFCDMAEVESSLDVVYGLGDVFDKVRYGMRRMFTTDPAALLTERLIALARKKPVVLIEGNHDKDLIDWQQELKPIHVWRGSLWVYGYKLTHGYEFDLMCRSLPWRTLNHIAPCFYQPPSKLKRYGDFNKYQELVGLIHGKAISVCETCLRQEAEALGFEARGLLIGHTHQPLFISTESGLNVVDCGDFLDSCSWLEVWDNGLVIPRNLKQRRSGEP